MGFQADYCDNCSGSGREAVRIEGPEGDRTSSRECSKCGGKGIVRTNAPAEASGMTLTEAIARLEPLIPAGRTGPERKALRKMLKQAKEIKKHIDNYPVLTFRGENGTMRPEPEVTVQIREIIEHLEKETGEQGGPTNGPKPPHETPRGNKTLPAGLGPAAGSTGALSLQIRNWGMVDFSKILKIRFKPE